jgi:hypothetical protein
MNPGIFDPNNHVPEVTPGDEWDDAVGVAPTSGPGTAVIPPRRTSVEPPAAGPAKEPLLRVEAKENNFHISPRVPRSPVVEGPVRLEVQEITANVVRLGQETEAPAPPKVERLTKFHERPTRDRSEASSQGERRDWGDTHRFPWRWVVSAGIAIPLLIVAAFMLMPILNEPSKSSAKTDALEIDPVHPVDDSDPLSRLLLMQRDAAQRFDAFAKATQPSDVLPLLRRPAEVSELLQPQWRAIAAPANWQSGASSTWTVESLAGQATGRLEGLLPNHTRFSAYFTLEEGQLLLDWKATTGYGSASFSELIKGQGDPREIRGIIAPDLYYNRTLSEDSYQSYCLASAGADEVIWCYAPRQSDANAKLVRALLGGEILRDGKTATKITLRLERGPAGAQPNQWLVAEVLHFDWVSP